MTERALSISTQSAIPTPTFSASTSSIPANDARAVTDSLDEEAYTIKCICKFDDDDGSTIYCEKCDTWQHIECYYHGHVEEASSEDFDHKCGDCLPRPLDARAAIDRQRQRQNKAANEINEKKSKRPPKSHKKKIKPADLQVNGFHDQSGRKNSSPHDHNPPLKKAKSHRSHQSINSQVKPSPPYSARTNTNGHPPSPAHTPPEIPDDVQVHSFSDSFLSLYKNPISIATVNQFETIAVFNSMTSWVTDPIKLEMDTGISDRKDAFYTIKDSTKTDELKWPRLTVQEKHVTVGNKQVQWQYLTSSTPLADGGIIAELNGMIGFQQAYCLNPDNEWAVAPHPKPFVFAIHPRLPLYVDTRQEGSICRFARRSCRPNSNWETNIRTGIPDYHFWLIADRLIPADVEITIPWDFQTPIAEILQLNHGEDDGIVDSSDMPFEEYQRISSIIHTVLSDHGGCACDLGNDCSFARFHRNYNGKAHDVVTSTNGISDGAIVKSKKGGRKPKQHVSPTSTGHATNSRAASEGRPEGPEEDGRSVSGSSRSKPQSRDFTPLAEAPVTLTETSDREKRKLAALEGQFQKLEQQPAPRKKKRFSDGSVNPSVTTQHPASKQRRRSMARISTSQPSTVNGNGHRGKHYVDASTSRRPSGSPSSGISPRAANPSPRLPQSREASVHSRQTSVTPRVIYVDSSAQTDPDINAWYEIKQLAASRRRIVPLSTRLFKNRSRAHKLRDDAQQEQLSILSKGIEEPCLLSSLSARTELDAHPCDTFPHADSPSAPSEARFRTSSISSTAPSVDGSATAVDITMTDALLTAVSHTTKPPPPPWPGVVYPTSQGPVDLRVQMPPTFPAPLLTTPISASSTPSTAITMTLPSFSPTLTVAPSPIKKKMSLGEYQKTRGAKGIRKSSSTDSVILAGMKPALATIEEAKARGALESGSAIIDTPSRDVVTEVPTAVGVLAAESATQSEISVTL